MVHKSPAFEGFPEESAWVERLADHPEEEDNLTRLLETEKHLVAAYILLALEAMKAPGLRLVLGNFENRREKVTLLCGSFSTAMDLGGLARSIRKKLDARPSS